MGNEETVSPILPPNGAPLQFFRLDRLHSDVDPSDSRFQFAMLVFQGDPEAFHDSFFDPCIGVTQTMRIAGLPSMDLSIELSCAMHPLQHVLRAATALKIAAMALGTAIAGRVKGIHAPRTGSKDKAPLEPVFGGTANDTDDRGPFRKTG